MGIRWWESSKSAPAKRAPAAVPRADPWHAVSVQTRPESCAVARALLGLRFLSARAPGIPLAQCPRKDTCPCFYKHHADRRCASRRREEITGLRRNVRIPQERRQLRGRRQTDLW